MAIAVPAQILTSATGTARRRPAAAAAPSRKTKLCKRTDPAVAAPHKGEGQPVLGGSDKSPHEDSRDLQSAKPGPLEKERAARAGRREQVSRRTTRRVGGGETARRQVKCWGSTEVVS